MNERIKELMGETLDDKFAGTWNTMTHEDLLKFSEKFADLVVQECAQTILANSDRYRKEYFAALVLQTFSEDVE